MAEANEEINELTYGVVTDKIIPIDLYLLWRTPEKENFTIQALFSPEAKYDFKLVSRLSDGTNQDQDPCIYQLHLDLTTNNDGELIIKHKKIIYKALQYELRISQKGRVYNSHYSEANFRRFDNINDQHCFLFDVLFQRSSPGGEVSYWKNLCFFTYYLLDHRQFKIFEIFLQQFQLHMHTNEITLSKSNFISFVKTTFACFSNKERIIDHRTALIHIVSMMGMLPLDKNNFAFADNYARKCSILILKKVAPQLASVFEEMDGNQWNLFKNGLVTLMSIEIFNNEDINTDYDSISLLNRIPIKDNQQKHLANTFLQELLKLKIPIERVSWTELLSIVDEEKLDFDCVCLATTLDHILRCLEHIVLLYEINGEMKSNLTKIFETKLRDNINLTLTLHGIVDILRYLNQQPSATEPKAEHICLIQNVVESSIELRRKIMKCLDNLNVQITHLELLKDLFRHYNAFLLHDLDKTTYLMNTLHGREKRSCEFYTTWFEYFLCDVDYVQTEQESQQFQQLLKEWSKKFQDDRDLLEQITLKLNLLLDKLKAVIKPKTHDQRLDYFIKHMINIYFQQNPIYEMVTKIGPYLQNKMILDAFVNRFVADYIEPNKYNMKNMTYYYNPLNRLIELCHRQSQQITNELLTRLFARCALEIRPDEDELLRHTFLEPARDTCTYVILFDDYFASLPIRNETLNRLNDIWSTWEKQQLTYEQLWRKKHYHAEQECYFNKIWDTVGKYNTRQYQIGVLFDTADKDMMEKTRTKEKITTCLNEYCDRANDRQKYLDLLMEMQRQLERSVISHIQIPPELKQLVPLVERLIPFSQSNIWLRFYHKRVQEQDSDAKQSHNNDEHWDGNLIDEIPNRIVPPVTTADSQPVPININYTCMEVLTRATKVLDLFQRELQTVCVQWNTIPILQLLNLFPDVQSAETDIHLLKTFIEAAGFPYLLAILNFWKQRSYLQHVYHGIKHLLNYLKVSLDENPSVVIESLNDLLTINEQTLGQACYDHYQRYIITCADKYKPQVLILWSHYSVSRDVIDFLHKISATEMDNLLEAVNDWDDTLISTRTVMDFATLKTFFDQVYGMIRAQEAMPTVDYIAACFEKISQVAEFQRIVDLFPTCSASLLAIQRLYLELTNKEQSKRQRIIDIMHKSSITFEQNPGKKYEFNVRLHPQNVTYADLSELRDRARLIEYSSGNKFKREAELNTEQLQQFISFVNVIETILKTLSSLFIASHPSITSYNRTEILTCIDGQFNDLQQLCTDLKQSLDDWERDLCRVYEEYPELTHFFCEQFHAIEHVLYNNDDTSNGFHLIKYIDFQPEQLRQGITAPKPIPKHPIEHLENLGRIFTTQRVYSQVNLVSRKVWLVDTNEDGILRALFSLFHLTKNPAHVHQLFYCTERTNWPEIRAFIYRCFFSQTLQILIRPQLLSADIQDRVVPLLRGFIERYPARYFSLGLISTSAAQNVQVINALKGLNIVTTLRDQDLLSKDGFANQLKTMLRHCTLVTSGLAGLGKTSLIQEQVRRLGKSLIKFPIGGDVRGDRIAKRLAKHTAEITNSALHIDIGPVDNIRTLDEILYCLILFHSFRFGQMAISIPADAPIFIELDASPLAINQDCLTIYPYLESRYYLERVQWDEFQHHLPEIQFVINYLDAIQSTAIIQSNINNENLSAINKNNCLQILQAHFCPGKTPEFITWTQLHIYLSIFYSLFHGFSRCSHFFVDCLEQPQLRLDILQAFLRSSEQFTSLSVENVRKQQRASSAIQGDVAIPPLALTDSVIRWENTQPFTVVFTSTHDPLFVYKTVNDVPKSLIEAYKLFYQAFVPNTGQNNRNFVETDVFPDHSQLSHVEFFLKLTSLSYKYFNKAICRKCYKQFPYQTIKCAYCATDEVLVKPISHKSDDIIAFQTSIATSLESQYVLTPDNYIKMLLVFLRVQSGLPVLIMGETGCGKTALISFLCQIILDDELEIFRMHAGINVEKIYDRMKQLIVRAEEYENEEKRLWVFFDEFNTTRSIGIIKEITCERTLLGRPLPTNMIFLGACNPRRYKPDQAVFDNNIGIKKERYDVEQLHAAIGGERLLYTVVPLPETMLEYVWDYGFLDRETEKKYISTMLKTCEHLSTQARWFNALVTLICKSQAFIRDIEDVSSVSLRDVSRFCRLFNWYHASAIVRTTGSASPAVTLRRAGITALLLCYYFRLKSPEHKREYLDIVETTLIEIFREHTVKRGFVLYWLKEEEMDIINRMELPLGTAKNRALLENIFVLLACIVNRIALVICGKPGCSKTSAVQIVISNLKGKKSHNLFLQTLPELIAVSYQGSQNCTSESIEKVFERASKYLTAQKDSVLLPVIVFDEIGLAELSPHNPLKVLHAELEVETCKYGFVGISNWRLDASKMNRTLYLACPDPDDEDLKTTGIVIAESMLSDLEVARLGREILPGLATAYYELFTSLKMIQKYEYYFGLRDFYSLIKGVVREIQTHPNLDIYEIIRRQVTVNFDGVVDGATLMWSTFCKTLQREELIFQYQPPNLKQLLDRNLGLRSQGRYLMLIAESESAIDYVERYIHTSPYRRTQNVRTLVGSQMPGDLVSSHTYTETYSYRVLMDIILYAETSVTLVMRQLGHLYDNLYDLFNQNFAVSAQKKYCRIALGALYHPRCLVNDDFYCIVFINQQDVDKCDPPFLNRFEKHPITIKDLVPIHHWEMTNRLLNWIADLLPIRQNDHFPLLQHLFMGYNADHMCSLVIDTWEELHRQEQPIDEQTVMNSCQEKLLRVASFDLALMLALKGNQEELIQQYYNIHARSNFPDILTRDVFKQIIYTYTQIYDDILYDHTTIDEIKLGNFKTELELVEKIKVHYHSNNNAKHRLLIRVDYRTEYKQLLSLKNILLNAYQEHNQVNTRSVWLIIHLQRNMLAEATNDVLFDNWSIDMIDDLNAQGLIHQEIIRNPSYLALLNNEQFSLSECLFDELIERCLSKFYYGVTNRETESRINRRRKQIIDSLVINKTVFSLRQIIQEKLARSMTDIPHPGESGRYVDWRQDLFSDARTIATSHSFKDAFQSTITYFYERYFLLLFAHLQQFGFIDSYLFIIRTRDEQIQQVWLDCLHSTLKSIDTTVLNMDTVEVPPIFDLRLPCAIAEYNVLQQIWKIIQQRTEGGMNFDDDEQGEENENFVFEQLQEKSVYKNQFHNDEIFHNPTLFQHYLHDQLRRFLTEHNIHLSVDFVLQLTTSNPTLNNKSRLKYLLINHEELLKLLNIFEKGCQLVGEETLAHICTKQFLVTDDIIIEKNDLYYTLVYTKDSFFQLLPNQINIKDKFRMKCSGDPFIENSLMNLIELILSPDTIERVISIELLATTCSLICQGILILPNYSVNNLERLRSFISLIRCIISLTMNQSLTILKEVCTPGLGAMFDSCQSIHEFVDGLSQKFERAQVAADVETIHRTIVKLEVNLLKHWLESNPNRYDEILHLIGRNDNHLWRYSAKIFSYILQKLDLVKSIQEHHDQIPHNDDYTHIEEYLQSDKIQRLLVDRIHMDLMLSITEDQFAGRLADEYDHFEKKFQSMIVLLSDEQRRSHHFRSICLLSWLKYYTHIYAFALNNDWRFETMQMIDRLLTNNESPFSTTLKLFIIKQLIHMSNSTLNEICERFLPNQHLWIKPLLNRVRQSKNEIREEITMPTPLFDGRQEFLRISTVLNQINNINEIGTLIDECAQNQPLLYSLYIWFLQRYCRFYFPEAQVDENLLKLIRNEWKQSLLTLCTPIGYKLILSLCTNFTPISYFHLVPILSNTELNCRLLALNMTILCLSTRAQPQLTYLGTLLFNNQRQMPVSYVDHIQSICLLGSVFGDPVATQMLDVRTRIQERLDAQQIVRQNSFMYQCSQECQWIFYFEDCGVPNSRGRCPLCKKDIGAERYGVLVARQPPQIQMTIDHGFQTINQYLDTFNRQVRLGYYNSTPADQSILGEKSDHLNRSVSYRFLHMFTHAQFLVLFELGYLSVENLQQQMNIPNQQHFQEHLEKDYDLLSRTCTDPEQCYVWLYKLINHMLLPALIRVGPLDAQTKVVDMEKTIEQNIIFPHIMSLTDEINQYRVTYAEFIRERDSQPRLKDYINELYEKEELYPCLSFFSSSKIITSSPLDEFRVKFDTLPFSNQLYPVTAFLLKRLDNYENIQHLYPIVEFTNYLLHKYNYRIKRNDAAMKTIEDCLNEARTDRETMRIHFDQFLHAWYKLDLTEVQAGCQRPPVDRPTTAANFARDTGLALLLINTSKDASSLLVVAYLHTLSKMQNEIIGYFNNMILNETIHFPHIPVQAIKAEHVFRYDAEELREKLDRDGFVINFEYGKGRDLIYDFEEIEITLRNLVSRLHILDYEKLQVFNYQFELYAENTSLITQIRQRVPQQPLLVNEQEKWRKLLITMNNDEIVSSIGSLDYIFTYLCNVEENEVKNGTLQTFLEKYIGQQACLQDNIFRRPPFSTIPFTYIIAFYEMIEEIAFDNVLRTYVKPELRDAKWPDEANFGQFVAQTYGKTDIPTVLQTSAVWIGTLKRLLMRVLSANTIHLDTPLQYYLERIDMWSGNITEEHLQSVEIQEIFLLQHTYIILCELELRERALRQTELPLNTGRTIPNIEDQITNARKYITTVGGTSVRKTVPNKPSTTKSDKRLRIL